MAQTFWVETLGCPKNQVDSDKLTGTLLADGLSPARAASDADLVVVNTCAFIDQARQESIETILDLGEHRRQGARLVVTGCLAERYGDEVAEAVPEADLVAGFGVPVTLTSKGAARAGQPDVPSFDLLNLPRPAASAPWAYVKVAEGCDRACGFCAIPSFRGPQRSRLAAGDILAEVDALGVREVVLVAQDLASYGRDQGQGRRQLVELVGAVAHRVERVRLLYLYPSDLTDELVEAVLGTGVAYFDLSLQHASAPLLRKMRRWGDGDRFAARIEAIRALEPGAAFRSNFIVGYPGETEDDHDRLLRFVAQAQLDWCGLFPYSEEEGTHAAGLDGAVPRALVAERLAEVAELAERITAARRDALIGTTVDVLVDAPGVARSYREAPEIDGVIAVPDDLPVGEVVGVRVVGAAGPDLEAVPLARRPLVGGVAGVSAAEPPPEALEAGAGPTYGPSALATPANAVTVVRLLVAPVLFAMIAADPATWTNFVLWGVLSATDGIDGFIARRHGATRSGAFLDPLADKVLVLGAMCALVAAGAFALVPVAVIAVREVVISLFRVRLARQGLAVPARPSAKLKTLLQTLAVAAALMPTLVEHTWLAYVLLWASVFMAVVSGFQYLRDGRRAATSMAR